MAMGKKAKFASAKPINSNTGKKGREKYNYNASVVRNANQYSDKTVFGARQGGKPK